jgi:hypothetical protein
MDPAPCSLTTLFTCKSKNAESSWIDFPEPLATKILRYKIAFQNLLLNILKGEPKIGHYFEKIEEEFEKILQINDGM